jgi:Hsp70 protein
MEHVRIALSSFTTAGYNLRTVCKCKYSARQSTTQQTAATVHANAVLLTAAAGAAQQQQDACQIAGMNCLRLMHESTATALAYGIYKSAKGQFSETKPQHVLFVDLGHSGFSASVCTFLQVNCAQQNCFIVCVVCYWFSSTCALTVLKLGTSSITTAHESLLEVLLVHRKLTVVAVEAALALLLVLTHAHYCHCYYYRYYHYCRER